MKTTGPYSDLEIGDELTVVVVHPNADRDSDPAAKINNTTAWIRFDSDYDPAFGEEIPVRVADVTDHHILVVPANPEDYHE